MGRNRTRAFHIKNPSPGDRDYLRELLMNTGHAPGGNELGGRRPIPPAPDFPDPASPDGGLTDEELSALSTGPSGEYGPPTREEFEGTRAPAHADDGTFSPDDWISYANQNRNDETNKFAGEDLTPLMQGAMPGGATSTLDAPLGIEQEAPWEDEVMSVPPPQPRRGGGGWDWSAGLMTALAGPEAGLSLRGQHQQAQQAQTQAELQDRRLRQQQEYQNAVLAGRGSPEDRERSLAIREQDLKDKMERFNQGLPRKDRGLDQKDVGLGLQERGLDQSAQAEANKDPRQQRGFEQQVNMEGLRQENREKNRAGATAAHAERLRNDPKFAFTQQSDMTATKQSLNDAIRGFRSLSPEGRDALAKYGAQGTIGSILQKATLSEADRKVLPSVWGSLNELVKMRAGSAVTESEWGRTAREIGLGTGTWDPFNSPEAIDGYLKRANEAITRRRSDYERIMGGWK